MVRSHNGNGTKKKGDRRQDHIVEEKQMSASVFDDYLSFVSIS